MKRRIFNAIAVLSAVLCVGTTYMWKRSFSHWDSVDWSRGWTCWGLRSTDGILGIQFNRHDPADSTPYYYFDASSRPPFEPFDWSKAREMLGVVTWEDTWRDRYWWLPETVFEFGGVWVSSASTSNVIHGTHPGCWAVDARYHVLVTLTGILPAIAVSMVVWKSWRRKSGHCVECGHDLRATPDRCPECGAVAEKSAV